MKKSSLFPLTALTAITSIIAWYPHAGVAEGELPATGDALPIETAPLPVTESLNSLTTTGLKALLYHSDRSSSAAFLESRLVNTGLFSAADIDILRMPATPPPVETLQAYDCVYVWTNFGPPNPVAQGDRLKEYVDAGGGVILTTYAYSPIPRPWEMQGGIMQPGYSPLVIPGGNVSLSPFPRSLDFSTALTDHPMLDGVTDFTYGGNRNYTPLTLDPGATLVGSDNFGVPLLGINLASNVAGVNLFPGNVFSKSAGVFQTLANACVAVSRIEVSVDIKPGSCPNPLNCNAQGVLPVAIAGTADLDAAQIDPVTVRLAGVEPLRSDLEDVTTPFEPFVGKQDCDVDCSVLGPDGLPDLTLKFDLQAVVTALGDAVQDGACVVAELTGNLRESAGGKQIVGEDVMRVLCKGPPAN
ncbi:MAG: hypothetical protein ABFR65_06195 [Pseudomonadota bacterium]